MTARRPRIAVAAYGRWIRAEDNPPALILDQLRAMDWPDLDLIPYEMPVEGAHLQARLGAVLDQGCDALIGVGLAAGSSVIRVETTAINTCDYRVPDALGDQPCNTPVIAGGPVGYHATVPVSGIVDDLRAADIPAQLSHHAGTHCCNQMLYLARHLVEARGLSTQCGFIHVPFTHAHMARLTVNEGVQPSMALATLTEALAITMRRIAAGVR